MRGRLNSWNWPEPASLHLNRSNIRTRNSRAAGAPEEEAEQAEAIDSPAALGVLDRRVRIDASPTLATPRHRNVLISQIPTGLLHGCGGKLTRFFLVSILPVAAPHRLHHIPPACQVSRAPLA